jgi:hypothetical protein
MTLTRPIEEASKELHAFLMNIPFNMTGDGKTRKLTSDLRLDARRTVGK